MYISRATRIEARRGRALEKNIQQKKEGGRKRQRRETKGKKEERNGIEFRKLLLPRRATISLRAGNFYDEVTRAGRGNTRGDEVLSTCNMRRYSHSSPGNNDSLRILKCVDTHGANHWEQWIEQRFCIIKVKIVKSFSRKFYNVYSSFFKKKNLFLKNIFNK